MGAGLGFKTFVTGDVLTAADTNGYLMQGVWVFADAAARTAAVTSPQEGNMSYLKDTNSTEYYSGSAWVAVGTSGGMTLLNGSGTTLTGSSVNITGISGSYQNLFVEFIDYYSSSSASLQVRFNSDSTAQAYQMISNYYAADNANAQFAPYLDKFNLIYVTYGSVSAADNNNYGNLTIPNYASSTVKKVYDGQSQFINASGYNSLGMFQGGWFNSSAITSIQVITSGGTFSGGTVKVWGIK